MQFEEFEMAKNVNFLNKIPIIPFSDRHGIDLSLFFLLYEATICRRDNTLQIKEEMLSFNLRQKLSFRTGDGGRGGSHDLALIRISVSGLLMPSKRTTSLQRCCSVTTLQRRCCYVVCLLGEK